MKLFLQADFIIRETEKAILQKKAEIYHPLTISIEKDLLPCYEGMTIHLIFSSFYTECSFDFYRITPIWPQKKSPGLQSGC